MKEKKKLNLTENMKASSIRLGKSKQFNEEMTKTTLTVNLSHIVWLDRLCSSIREKSHTIVDRGSIIRAILTAFRKSEFNITHCSNEEEIAEVVAKKLEQK